MHTACGDCANPHMHTGISVHEIPVWFARPRMHMGIDLDPRMHMGIACHVIPVCIRGFAQSPCAYGDHGDPSMHTGKAWHIIPTCILGSRSIPLCIRGSGIAQIPVCIWGSHDMLSLYACRDWSWSLYSYGDLRDPRMHTGSYLNPCTHMGIAERSLPVCVQWPLYA